MPRGALPVQVGFAQNVILSSDAIWTQGDNNCMQNVTNYRNPYFLGKAVQVIDFSRASLCQKWTEHGSTSSP